MSALTTLDGLDVGTDIAIMQGGRVRHWTVAEGGGLTREGMVLDPWFLTGALAAGKVTHGDFAPAQPGEWFLYTGRWLYLVLEADGDTVQVARFQADGVFSRFEQISNVPDYASRQGRPGWSGDGPQFLAMTQLAWRQKKLAEEYRTKVESLPRMADYLRYIHDYTERAQRLIT